MRRFELGVQAFVKVPIVVRPRHVALFVREGESLTRVVEISAGLDKPLELSPVGFNLEGKVTYRLEEAEKGKRFRLHVTALPGMGDSHSGFLNLKTNYEEEPVLNIQISVRFRKPVAVKGSHQ
jgi:hypothetical protein